MKYDLVKHNHMQLHTVAEDFDFSNPPVDPVDLACDLAETMLHYNGIGIAANQCGLPYRCCVLYGEELIPMFNPRIVDTSIESILLEEGCLSYPGILVKVRRAKKIRVRFTEPNGITSTKVFDGLTARIAQHEIDHLDGLCYIDAASYIHREKALKQIRALDLKQI